MKDASINELIFEVRGKKVILDKDLAKLYGFKNGTKSLNLLVKRHINKFPETSMFKLTEKEVSKLSSRFQIETLNNSKNNRGSNIKYMPYAFTSEGIKVLMTLLKIDNVVLISNKIIECLEEKKKNIEISQTPVITGQNEEKIENLIYEIRGVQVMLDSDLAKLYGCVNGTKDINKAVKRNMERFPKDFYFKLTEDEFNILRFQIGTANLNKVRSLPYVFTEQGTAQLSSVLRTENAAIISVGIMRAFVNMRHYINDNNIIFESMSHMRNQIDTHTQKLKDYDEKLIEHDEKFNEIFSKFENKELKEMTFFDGQIYDAYSKIVDILKRANKKLIIIDAYADKSVLDITSKLNVKVTLIVKYNSLISKREILVYNKQYNNLKVIYSDCYHDRYFILDESIVYHCGASINRAGKKVFSVSELGDNLMKEAIIDKVTKEITEKLQI